MSLQVMNPNLVEADWEIDSEAVRPSDGGKESLSTPKSSNKSAPFTIQFALLYCCQMFGLRIVSGDYSVSDVVSGQTVPATWSDGHLQLRTSLRPGEIWLIKILST